VNWVIDADIRGFFDNMSHEWTMKFIEHRVADRRILRLIQKWLKAGVSEDGRRSETKVGTPQGAVVSPLLANVYLHYVFDLWVEVWRKKVARGDVIAGVMPTILLWAFNTELTPSGSCQNFGTGW
jgi:RNA-directed DNA polymerase